MTKSSLFKDFPPISSEEWRSKVEADLKGADFNKKLVWHTEEGFDVLPYYRKEDLEKSGALNIAAPVTDPEGAGNDWKIRQDFDTTLSPEACNCVIKAALNKGIQAIGLNLSGYDDLQPKQVHQLLDGVDLSAYELYFTGCKNPEVLLSALEQQAKDQKTDPSLIKGSLGIDPFGELSANGKIDEKQLEELPGIVLKCEKTFPNLKCITVNAGIFQDGGSTLSQELGFGLSMADEYLRILTEKGVGPGSAMSTISFSLTTGPNYFMEIAKLRAARWLWKAIAEAWKVDQAQDLHIQTRSASWNMTVYDPHVNMLRTTTEAMSASLGGSDVISLHPFDKLYRDENDFSSRIARNIQIILKEEAYFDKVADPAAGSYYIENLTRSLGEQAWNHFLDSGEKGGFREALTSGSIAKEIAESARKKVERAASRRDTILGVNQYPNFNEMIWKEGMKMPSDLSSGSVSGDSASTGAKSGKSTSAGSSKKSDETWEFASFPVIRPFRAAGELEKLRLETEKSGIRPKVFLLKYGDPAWRTARAMFAGNFFACAGYEIIDKPGFPDLKKGIKAAADSGADIVVLCSADDTYVEASAAAVGVLKEKQIVIAGFPKETMEQIKANGISRFIHVRSNLLEELRSFHRIFNIG